MSTSLCNTCQRIFRLHDYWRFIYEETTWSELYKYKSTSIKKHHPTFESFQDAVQSGCYICVLLQEAIPKERDKEQMKGYSSSWQARVDRDGERGTRESYVVAVCLHQGCLSSSADPDVDKITAKFSLWRKWQFLSCSGKDMLNRGTRSTDIFTS